MSAQPGTDWDNLEGVELNVALAHRVGRITWKEDGRWWMEWGDNDPWVPVPDYANSIDEQKRDLEPLLAPIVYRQSHTDSTLIALRDERIEEILFESPGPEPLARARCLGKALEARQ